MFETFCYLNVIWNIFKKKKIRKRISKNVRLFFVDTKNNWLAWRQQRDCVVGRAVPIMPGTAAPAGRSLTRLRVAVCFCRPLPGRKSAGVRGPPFQLASRPAMTPLSFRQGSHPRGDQQLRWPGRAPNMPPRSSAFEPDRLDVVSADLFCWADLLYSVPFAPLPLATGACTFTVIALCVNTKAQPGLKR